jgi:hypothetical protein
MALDRQGKSITKGRSQSPIKPARANLCVSNRICIKTMVEEI